MQTIVGSSVEDYLYSLLPARDSVLTKMEEEAAIRKIPIVGPLVGRFFYQLALVHQPNRIFEMGSAIGYSTIWWARAVGASGEVHYTDGNKKNAEEAERWFNDAGVTGSIKIHVGSAFDILDSTSGLFDIIFCDIDKGDYPAAFRKAIPRLRKGGLLVADNVLWGGRVAESGGGDQWTEAIREFNKLLYSTEGIFSTIIPLRDGLSLSLKL